MNVQKPSRSPDLTVGLPVLLLSACFGFIATPLLGVSQPNWVCMWLYKQACRLGLWLPREGLFPGCVMQIPFLPLQKSWLGLWSQRLWVGIQAPPCLGET